MKAVVCGAVCSEYMFYALPLIIAISLVYAATRHEQWRPILVHAMRIGVWIVGFMAAILVVLLLFNWAVL